MPTGGWPLAIDVPGVGRIRGIEFGRDDGPIALLVHGWAGWREQLSAFVEPLTVQGYRVVVVDLPGHGETAGGRLAGRSSTAVEMAEAIAGVARAVGPIRLLVAHSLGAMALVWAAARHDMRFDAAVMIAPIAAVSPVIDVFQAGCGFGPETRRRLVPLLERRLGRTLAEFDVSGMVGRILADRSVPLLVVHDATDDSAPSAGARAIVDAWAGSDLELTVGLGHRKVLWDPAVVRRVADFAARTQQVAEL
jgi:pimeloyl-ACP methyl ester carboxylesterase